MHDFHHSHIHAKGTKMSMTFCLRSKVLMVEWQKESFPSSCHSKHLSLAFLFVLVQHCQIKNGGSKRLGYIISVLCFFFLSFVFETGSYCVIQASPELIVLPSLAPNLQSFYEHLLSARITIVHHYVVGWAGSSSASLFSLTNWDRELYWVNA